MNNDNNKTFKISDSELNEVAGGTGLTESTKNLKDGDNKPQPLYGVTRPVVGVKYGYVPVNPDKDKKGDKDNKDALLPPKK